VERSLRIVALPSARWRITSVNVPPTSTPIRALLSVAVMRAKVAI
jgi:hypothetical protein